MATHNNIASDDNVDMAGLKEQVMASISNLVSSNDRDREMSCGNSSQPIEHKASNKIVTH
jgi:hypothetical protein